MKGRRVSREAAFEFTEIMAALLDAGNTAENALSLAADIGSGAVRSLSGGLREAVSRGESFSESLAARDDVFPPLYRALVRIGEETGTVAAVFRRLVDYLATRKNFSDTLRGALLYPAIVLVTALAGTVALLLFVLPRMAEIFAVMGAGNDGAAREQVSSMYRTVYGICIITALAAVLAAAVPVVRSCSAAARSLTDRIVISLPAVGAFIVALESLDFFFAMELCASSSMSAEEALRRSSPVARNYAYRAALENVSEKVRRGDTLEAAFKAESLFPGYIASWLAVGELTGAGEAVFAHLRRFFQARAERTRTNVVSLLEPALILCAGIVLLVLILNLIVPLYGLYGAGL